jgi:hypothetical protein
MRSGLCRSAQWLCGRGLCWLSAGSGLDRLVSGLVCPSGLAGLSAGLWVALLCSPLCSPAGLSPSLFLTPLPFRPRDNRSLSLSISHLSLSISQSLSRSHELHSSHSTTAHLFSIFSSTSISIFHLTSHRLTPPSHTTFSRTSHLHPFRLHGPPPPPPSPTPQPSTFQLSTSIATLNPQFSIPSFRTPAPPPHLIGKQPPP